MPSQKKHPKELTTEEAIKKLFPKPVREEAKREAENAGSPAKTSIEKKSK